VIVETDKKSGAMVPYTLPATTDTVDGIGTAVCTPPSGSLFPLGVTTVTCTATDSHGNSAAPVTFLVIMKYEPKDTGALIIGNGLVKLDCFTTLNVFGVKVTFHNLCDHQTIITDIESNTLPGQLPGSVTFVQGLNVTVLFEDALVKELPLNSGIQLDFAIPVDSQDQFAVLLWDDENKEWLDVTQTMKDEDLAKMLAADSEDELYQIVPTETTKALFRILTTEKTGTFVIVKK
jgi:HYR domain